MYARFFVPVSDCAHVLRCHSWAMRPATSLPSRPSFLGVLTHLFCLPAMLTRFTCLLPYNQKPRDRCCVPNSGAVLQHFHVRLCRVLERCWAWSSCSVCCEVSFEDYRWQWEWVTKWYDWRSPGANPPSRSTVFSPHRDTVVNCVTNDTLTTSSSNTACYDYRRQALPTVRHPTYDASSPCLLGRPLRSFPWRNCCSAPAATSSGDILDCILCYRLLFTVYLLVFHPRHCVSHNYRILLSFYHLCLITAV